LGSESDDLKWLDEVSDRASTEEVSESESDDSSDAPISSFTSPSPGAADETETKLGGFVALQGWLETDGEVVFVGKVIEERGKKLTVRYMEKKTDDYGGCWKLLTSSKQVKKDPTL
jgi:hypothetical protein